MSLTLTTAQAAAVIRLCARCLGLCTETAPGVFTHITSMCRECLPTGGRDCEYQNLHGQQQRFEHKTGPVACLVADPQTCRTCHQELVVTHDGQNLRGVCIDHPYCCGSCCTSRTTGSADRLEEASVPYVWIWPSPDGNILFRSEARAKTHIGDLFPGGTWAFHDHHRTPGWEYALPNGKRYSFFRQDVY